MNGISRWVFVSLAAGLAAAASAADRYVAQNGQTPVSPYTNWTTAASNVQDAVIASANRGDTIWVGAGRYTAPTNAVNGFATTNVVYLSKAMTLRSSNGLPESVVIDGGGSNRCIAIAPAWNTYDQFILIGLTLSNGLAQGTEATGAGGGLLIQSPDGNTFTTEVYNCVIRNNTGAGGFGGVNLYDTGRARSLILSNTVVRNNANGGMNLRLFDGYAAITDCRIEENSGTALYLYRGLNDIRNTVFQGNTNAANYGVGAVCFYGLHRFWNCLFLNNYCGGSYGGAVGCSSCGTELYNCTVVSNRTAAGSTGGLYAHWNGTNVLWNTVVYSNFVGTTHANWVAPIYATNSCTTPITGMSGGANNTAANPLFVNYAAQDFRLAAGSPCINTGVNQPWMATAVDLDGRARLDWFIRQVDMGAYEYVPEGTLVGAR